VFAAPSLQQSRSAALRAGGARRVLDLGCGEGPLLRRLLEMDDLEQIVGLDISATAIGALRSRYCADARVSLFHASFTEPDPRFENFDAAVMLETIEHINPSDLSRLERVLFGRHRPRQILSTTPNADCNAALGVPSHRPRHPDHRFE